MDYVELNIEITSEEQGEILVAELAEYPFESFESEGKSRLKGYIPQDKLADCKDDVDAMLARYCVVGARYISIETQNWNAQWESNFDRVEVGGRLLIRAPFHDEDRSFEREVIIMPKMSFGTGHHSTTHLMAEWTMDLGDEGVLDGRDGLDMGSGTGVLAIVAAKCGARRVDAVDIDDWAYENCCENIVVNGVEGRITPMLGDVGCVEGRSYDFVLANINRNILIATMPHFATMMRQGATLLISGFLESDISALDSSARDSGLSVVGHRVRDGWVVMRLQK